MHRQISGIIFLYTRHARIGCKLWVKLTATRINGRYVPCTVSQQAIGKATGRSPDIDRTKPVGINVKATQRSIQLFTASPHKIFFSYGNCVITVDLQRGLLHYVPVYGNGTLQDQSLGTLATGSVAALKKVYVQSHNYNILMKKNL
jgi:hypothetical protein